MRVKHLLVAAIAAVALTSTARAAAPAPSSGQVYVGANLGLAIFHDNDVKSPADFTGSQTAAYKSGLGFAGALGYKHNPNLRVEAEIAYRKNSVDKIGGFTLSDTNLTIWNYGVNGYYDFANVNLPVKPFLGLGVGYASGKLQSGSFSSKDSQFSYQGIAGLAYPFDPNGNITFQYRYHSSSDFSKDGVTIAYSSSTFLAGITYAFSL
jgi:opacity protein-like surface antigen